MANHLLTSFARRDGPTADVKVNPSASPKAAGGSRAPKAGHIMIEEQEERFSDVVAVAYSVLALLLMLVWAYVPM